MQNKRSIHSSGPLGMLLRSGQVQKVDVAENQEVAPREQPERAVSSYFRTQSGIDFNESELLIVDPKECEPWEYANRLDVEMGNMNELVDSIRDNKQLQPALVRLHPQPHDGIKYEVIFGRRRHKACLILNIPFMVIKKELTNIQDAIAKQDAENKSREGVSNYANALLYKKLIKQGVFKTEKELATKLKMPITSLNDIMSLSKIPENIAAAIPDIHTLSIGMSLKINTLINRSKSASNSILALASQIGKTINSPIKLENAVQAQLNTKQALNTDDATMLYKTRDGKKLFSFKLNHRGVPSILINKELGKQINYEHLCDYLKSYIENLPD